MKALQAVVVVAMLAGLAFTFLYPSTIHIEVVKVTASRESRHQERCNPTSQGRARRYARRYCHRTLGAVARVGQGARPTFQLDRLDQVLRTCVLNGTSPTSFVNGTLFQAMAVVFVCLAVLAVAKRCGSTKKTDVEPVVATPGVLVALESGIPIRVLRLLPVSQVTGRMTRVEDKTRFDWCILVSCTSCLSFHRSGLCR